jgi:hypothetical protein
MSDSPRKMDRREFLASSALASGGILLLGCGSGGASESQPQPVSADTIAAENAKLGDPSWILVSPATNHEIEGYASATSVNRGQAINFYVSTQGKSHTIDIYRLGWYGGLGARRMMSTITLSGIQQPAPVQDPTTGLIECQWTHPYSLTVPNDTNDWVSGVYLAKLTAAQSGKQSYIIFVVRDDDRASTYLFQSSVTTFQAYNNWGGKSLYDYNSTGGRAAKVSFNRPYGLGPQTGDGSGVGAGEFLATFVPEVVSYGAGWECNMVRFLEKNGFDVTYCTDLDVHENASLLITHDAFLSVGHDEYWSWEQRTNVTHARDAGVNLAFFAADVCYWQIRFEPSPITGDANRTQVCYKDTSDPVTGPRQTLLWRDLGMPETELVGVKYLTDRADADIVVQNTDSWVFEGTELSDGLHIPGLLGYEVDAVDASSPSNLIILANSPFRFDSLPDAAVQYAQMATYTAGSGATVFATGSMQWNWGLDDHNAPSLRPSRLSPIAQRITQNVLAKLVRE